MIISAIAAMAKNRVIGKNGELPWKIPEDFKFFKDTTSGHIMIMGRKTFESLGGPLPNRLHVVVTRQKGFKAPGAETFHSLNEALAFCKTQVNATSKWGTEVFVIGGGEIYTEMLSLTDRIYLTEIHEDFDGDACFPEFTSEDFKEVSRRSRFEPLPFDFVVYERRVR